MNSDNKISASEQLRESLLDLARANSKERNARKEAEALLAGLDILTNYNNRDNMFENLLEVLREVIEFENAFILSQSNQLWNVVASTNPQYLNSDWNDSNIARPVSINKPLVFFDIDQVPQWIAHDELTKTNIKSALHVLLRDNNQYAILICTHSIRGFFSEKHLKLSVRFAPLASQALINLDHRLELELINEKLKLEITEKEKAQLMVINTSKMAALGEMASGIAHEINNPLTIIHGKASMLLKMSAKENFSIETNKTYLEQIVQTCDRIAKIVKGLKSVSRNGDHDPFAEVQLENLFSNIRFFCQERFKQHEVTLEIGEIPSIKIECIAVQVEQVILNLLNNAIDAIELNETKWVKIDFLKKETSIIISVTDSGKGIPDDIVEKIMQPFYSTKETGKGTGLGLSISKGIIENHKGTLTYDGSIGNTRFLIELPLKQ